MLGNIFVVGLFGDIFIFDDFFKSYGNSFIRLLKKVFLGFMEKVKQRLKDFWDILNEQNDDSFSKFIDLAVIEIFCEKVFFVVFFKRKEQLEISFWKLNENFLWKIINLNDIDENIINIQE